MKTICFLTSLALLAPMSALANEPAATAVPVASADAAQATSQPAERLICRKAPGSRRGAEKTCLTKKQWREIERASGSDDLNRELDRR